LQLGLWRWDYPDYPFSPHPSAFTISHTYPAVGNYTAVVTASNTVSVVTATTTVTITGPAPVLTITKTGPALVLPGAPITYTLTVTNSGPVSATQVVITDVVPVGASYITGGLRTGEVVSWTVASLANGDAVTATLAVTTTGIITNSDYRVSADGGVSADGQAAIETRLLDFSAEPLTGAAPLTVTFTNLATPTQVITDFLWDYGDGITNTTSAVTHTYQYTQSGVYTVSLTAAGVDNELTLTRTNYITVSSGAVAPPPSSWWNDDFFYRRPITLSASSVISYNTALTQVVKMTLDSATLVTDNKMRPDGKDLRVAYWDGWQWTELSRQVEDVGTTASTVLFPLQATITETTTAYWLYYGNAVPGPAPLLLEEYGQAGQPYTEVESGPDDLLYVDFQAEPVVGLAPLDVTLTNLSFPEPDSYRWDFGDGGVLSTSGAQTQTVHTYQTTGVYTVSLTAGGVFTWTSSEGEGATISDYITATYTYPGLIWVVGVDVSDQLAIEPGSSDETPVVSTILPANPDSTPVITSAEGNFSVTFPPGVLTEPVVITHTPYRAEINQGPGSLTRFDLVAETLAGQPVTGFSQPLTLTLDLGEFGVSDEMAETAIFLTWDESAQSWQPISTTIDLARHVVYGKVDHFTSFMGRLSGKPGGPPPVGAALASTVTDAASGAAVFAIPIEVPPGTAGMQPLVSIGYNSLQAQRELDADSGEVPGLLGLGTYLNLSYIARSNQKVDRDLYELGTDEYYLVMNGRKQKLIPTSSNSYHTADETFWLIERIGPDNPSDTAGCAGAANQSQADCAYWTVTTKDGTIYTFGQTADSIQKALAGGVDQGSGKVQAYVYPGRYYLNRVQDVNGNYMVFDYSKKVYSYTLYRPNEDFETVDTAYDEAVYLTDIRYTGNGLRPLQRLVHFDYEARAAGDKTDFLGAFPGEDNQRFYYHQRLKTIETSVDDSLARRYEFSYVDENEHESYLTRTGLLGLYPRHYLTLRKVSLFGDDGTPFDLQTAFDYYSEAPGILEYNEFGLLQRVNTLHRESGAIYNTVEYSYARYSDPLIEGIVDISTGWLVSQQTQTAPETEALTLTYNYDHVNRGPGQGPVVQILTDGTVSNYGNVAHDYRRVAMHDSLSNRTTIQAFYANGNFQTDPLAGRLAWTELFTDPQEYCLVKNNYSANSLCPLDSYLTGQYLSYYQDKTYCDEDGVNSAYFIAPESVVRGVGPLNNGQPHDWTETRYEYAVDSGNITQILERNDPDDTSDGRLTVIAYAPTEDERTANVLNRPEATYIYPEGQSDLLSCTRFSYNRNGVVLERVTQETYPAVAGACPIEPPEDNSILVSTLSFDTFGNVTQAEGAAGNYQVEYDPLYFTFPITTTYLGTNLKTSAAYKPALGLVEQSVAVNGAVTGYEYDSFGRLESVTTPAAEASAGYVYNYDDTGLTLTVTHADGIDGLATAQHYNGLGQLTWEATEAETGGQTIRVDYRYEQGRLRRVSVPYNSGGMASLWTRYEYDDLDRVTTVIQPDGNRQQTEYSGWSQRRLIDANEHVTDYQLDALGQVKTVTQYTGLPGSLTPYAVTTYGYNAQGHLTDVWDNAGNHTAMKYDGAGRMIELNDPDQGQWEYKYFTDGPLYHQKSPNIELEFTYDPQNRLTEITTPGDEGDDPLTLAIFGYDATLAGRGQRTSMTDPSGYTSYDYDPAGRLNSETRTIDGIVYRTGFTYDPLDRVKTLTYPDPSALPPTGVAGQAGEVVTYNYNNQGLLDEMSTSLGGGLNLVNQLDYNALGRPTAMGLGNGLLNWTYHYNDGSTGDPANLALHDMTVTGSGGALLDFSYGYAETGQLQNLNGTVGGVSLDLVYTYDDLDRLTAVAENAASGLNLGRSYGYDPLGNLTNKNGLLLQDYGPANNGGRLPHAPGQVVDGAETIDLTYDGAGNRARRSSGGLAVNYRYDALNRQAYVISGTLSADSVSQAVYDGDGQRVKRITAEGTTVTIGRHYEVFYPASPNQTVPTDDLSDVPHSAPRLAVDSQGHRHIVYSQWMSWDGYRLYYVHLDAAGQRVGYSYRWVGNEAPLAAAVDQAANVYVLRQDGDTQALRLDTISQNMWGDFTLISAGNVAQNEAALAVEGDGTAHVVWREYDDSLHYATVAGGSVSEQVLAAAVEPRWPQVAVDVAGVAHVVWRENDYPAAIRYTAIGGSVETVSGGSCPVNQYAQPVIAANPTNDEVYVAWAGGAEDDPASSGVVCLAVRSGGSWTVTEPGRRAHKNRLVLKAAATGGVYLLRGVHAPLEQGAAVEPKWGGQETLYLERFQAGQWQTVQSYLGNTYPGQDNYYSYYYSYSLLDGDMALDAAGAAYLAWIDNGEAWDEVYDHRLRTTQILSTTAPQVTKHYYAGDQRIASRVDDTLYYVLNEPSGLGTVFVDDTGAEAGHIIYDALGSVVEMTPGLPESLASHLDATGLQFDGQRYYDPWVGSYVQPDPFGGAPGVPQSLNRFAAASGSLSGYVSAQGGGLPSLVVDVGKVLANLYSPSAINWGVQQAAGQGVSYGAQRLAGYSLIRFSVSASRNKLLTRLP
ncbi:MAG: PKD domain-containing protein, partial [Chloroflexota bacterium]